MWIIIIIIDNNNIIIIIIIILLFLSKSYVLCNFKFFFAPVRANLTLFSPSI